MENDGLIDMFFKVKIQGQDPVSKQEIPNLKVITAPIKVISKPEQLKKRQTGSAPIQTNTILPPTITPAPVATTSNPNITVTTSNSKKRTVNDLVIEAVTRIEKQQYEQTSALDKILSYMGVPKQENSLNPNASWEFLPPLQKLSSSQRKGTSLAHSHPLPLSFPHFYLSKSPNHPFISVSIHF